MPAGASAGNAPPPEVLPYFDTYLAAVARGDRRAAVDVTLDMHEHGVPAEQVITALLAPAQVEVGRRWQQGTWGVALEHRATAIAEVALQAVSAAEVARGTVPPEGARGRAAVACSQGEWHSLPPRMLAEVLRLRGVDVSFVGPSMPASELAAFLGDEPPAVVAVSCSLPGSLVGAWRVVTALRALGVTVVCGGRGFGDQGQWGGAIGADSWAPTLATGADAVMAAIPDRPPPPRDTPVPPAIRDELAFMERSADLMVVRAVAEAASAWPVMLASDTAMVATRDDLRSTLAVVAAGVLVDDASVVTEFVAWFESVLLARDLPPAFVSTAFDLLGHHLPAGLERVDRMLRAGRDACTAVPLPRV